MILGMLWLAPIWADQRSPGWLLENVAIDAAFGLSAGLILYGFYRICTDP